MKVDSELEKNRIAAASVQAERPGALDKHNSGSNACPAKIAYIMSRFPSITETFVLYEMLAIEEHGLQVEVYPLQRERAEVMHPEARAFVARAHYQPLISWPILQANLSFLLPKPALYLGTLWTLIRANWGSSRYLIGRPWLFPQGCTLRTPDGG